MTPEEKKQLEELVAWKKSLESSSTIPLAVDQAFKGRFGLPKTSTKAATSENQAVNESGSSSYSVLGPPNGFVEEVVDGKIKYIPTYD
jgi:hypothetical protein